MLDYCALYFPAKRFIKILVEYVSPAVIHENPLYRRAALAALAITAEGCAGWNFFRFSRYNKYLYLNFNFKIIIEISTH